MWPQTNRNSLGLIIAAYVTLLSICTSAVAQTNATLHLKNGPVLSGEIKTIGPASLSITLAGTSSALPQNYTDIARIEWPEPDLWQEAMAAFDRGETKEALEHFSKLSAAPAEISFRPAPGNFAERARLMMLQCHRRLRDGAAITKLVRQIDWAKLPEEERAVSPLLKVWSLVGASDWSAARTAADEAAGGMSDTDPDLLELSFLQGRIARKLGLTDEAIATYAVCYTLPSPDPGLAADALRESAELFLALPERKDELKALAHLYATTIGGGKLWKDAPAEVAKLLGEDVAKPLASAQAKAKTPPTAGSSPAPAAGDWVTVTKFRFEPQPAGTPKPVPDPNKKPAKFEATGGTQKSTNAPEGWESAETRVAELTSGKSLATLIRELKEDPVMHLTKGKKLRLTMELRLGKLDAKVPKAVERSSFLRVGLMDANKAGYGINLSLLPGDKGISLMADPGGDNDLLGGPGIMRLPVEGSEQQGGVTGAKVLPCELTLQLQEDGKMLVTARVDQISGSVTVDASAGQPIVTNFSSGFFVIRLGKPQTTILFDNVSVEVSP